MSLISNKKSCIIISGGDVYQENGLLGSYIIGSFSGEDKEKPTFFRNQKMGGEYLEECFWS